MTFLEFFLLMLIWIPLIMLWIFALTDLAKRDDMSGLAKGLWAVAIVLLPLLGMILYFIARPKDAHYVKPADQRMADITAESSVTGSTVDQLEKLSDLKDSGAITDDEFTSMKQQILG